MFIRSGLKTQYQRNKGKLGLFIGNKRQEQLSGFELVLGVQVCVSMPLSLSLSLSPSLSLSCVCVNGSLLMRKA